MDNSTLNTLNKARVCMANGNFDQLKEIVDSLPAEVLFGTVFDRNGYGFCKEYIYLLLNELTKDKGIKSITQQDSDVLFKLDSNFYLSEKEIEDIFVNLKSNLRLYENKYENKVYKVNTDDNSVLLNVSACNLFHVLGFNFIRWQKEYKEEITKLFPEFKKMLSMDYKEICRDDKRVLYDSLYSLIRKKDKIIEEVSKRNPKTLDALNLHKVKIKNYMFERSDFTGSPSGIITTKPVVDCLKSDTFIIKDFINLNIQDWSYFAFRDVDERPYKCSESILYNYLLPNERIQQKVSLVTSIDTYDRKRLLNKMDLNDIDSKIIFSEVELEYLRTKLYERNTVVKTKKKTTV